MFASKTRPVRSEVGSVHAACMPQPRIHRFRNGSPGRQVRPRVVDISIASGHVHATAAAMYAARGAAAPSHLSAVTRERHQDVTSVRPARSRPVRLVAQDRHVHPTGSRDRPVEELHRQVQPQSPRRLVVLGAGKRQVERFTPYRHPRETSAIAMAIVDS